MDQIITSSTGTVYSAKVSGGRQQDPQENFQDTLLQKTLETDKESAKGRIGGVSIGFGTLILGEIGMGLSAKLLPREAGEDSIVRVTAANREQFDVNIQKVDPTNATAIEMFAFCQYADFNGTGVSKVEGASIQWDSWRTLKFFSVSQDEVLEYASMQDAAEIKSDWTKALEGHADLGLKDASTGEITDVTSVFRMLRDTLMAEHDISVRNREEKNKDWRTMDDEHWNRLIDYLDHFIDSVKEKLKRIKEIQKEAADRAMSGVPASMRSNVASRAMLEALCHGFSSQQTDSFEKEQVKEK